MVDFYPPPAGGIKIFPSRRRRLRRPARTPHPVAGGPGAVILTAPRLRRRRRRDDTPASCRPDTTRAGLLPARQPQKREKRSGVEGARASSGRLARAFDSAGEGEMIYPPRSRPRTSSQSREVRPPAPPRARAEPSDPYIIASASQNTQNIQKNQKSQNSMKVQNSLTIQKVTNTQKNQKSKTSRRASPSLDTIRKCGRMYL